MTVFRKSYPVATNIVGIDRKNSGGETRGVGKNGTFTGFALGESEHKIGNAFQKIDWHRKNGPGLDNDRVLFQNPIMKIDPKQRLTVAQMRGGAYRKKSRQS